MAPLEQRALVPHNCCMRKKVALLTVSALFLSIITPLANAAVKPGTKCAKQGQTSTSAGMKYTNVNVELGESATPEGVVEVVIKS